MDRKLKPCPFCGCKDIRKIEIEQYCGPWYFAICCTQCDALIKSRDLYLLNDEEKRKEYQEIDKKWNRRADDGKSIHSTTQKDDEKPKV